jgi:hypothetical protein
MMQIRQPASFNGFVDRLIGVLTLDVPTYRRIATDRSLTVPALAVVTVAAMATAIGRVSQYGWLMLAIVASVAAWIVISGRAYGFVASLTRKRAHESRLRSLRDQLSPRQQQAVLGVGAAILSLMVLGIDGDATGWNAVTLSIPFLSWISFTTVAWLQARNRPQAPSYTSLLRTVGFAHAPGILAIFGLVPLVGFFVALVVPIWAAATMVFAIRHTIGMTLDRSLAVAILATSCTAIATAFMVVIA